MSTEEAHASGSYVQASAPTAEAEAARAGHQAAPPRGKYLFVLALGALGVVYGDIGTSPLYALRECFHGPHAVAPTPANVLGVLSLITWSLIVVVSIKYLVFVMRADNRAEGGILALLALAVPPRSERSRRQWTLTALGLFGAALLYGDGVITPAISVLSAVEGLEIAAPALEPYLIPITVAILIGLFLVQHRGTAGVGAVFGPIMVVWFLVIGWLGLASLVNNPGVLAAVNPLHGAEFFLRNGWMGFLVLGAVFLVVTGGEALYADMGHFGKRPIRLAWFALALPALLLNYYGQGALLLQEPGAAEHPFYHLAPAWANLPLVLLATAATVIASQALISGAFSLTRQAVQLGYSPRVTVEHTSEREIGQIYIPSLNWALMLACIGLVLGFRSSSALAAAYGIAVTGTMAITTVLFYEVARHRWGWPKPAIAALALFFLVIDLAFFGANVVKIVQGGWFPLLVGAFVFTLLSTWKRGREVLAARLTALSLPLEDFLASLLRHPPTRVPGTAVFMHSGARGTPPALLHNLKHNQVLHTQVVLLTVTTEEVPYVAEEERAQAEPLGHGFFRVLLRYGFMEDPAVPKALERVQAPGLSLRPPETTYFLGRETLIASRRLGGMALWRERLFAWMARNATTATAYFCLPPNRVVELGAQVEI